MNYILGIEEQRKQLIAIIDYLKSTGISQKDIALEIGVDSIYMSHLRSGTIKYITPEVIEGLHDAYNINPQFIIHGASNMFDTAGLKYENFVKFVDYWDLVEHEDKEYLHFEMDENFYNFLVDVFNLKEASSNTTDVSKTAEAFDKALKSYRKSSTKNDYLHFSSDKDLFKFVLNVFNLRDDSSFSADSKKMEKAFYKALDSLKENYQPAKTSKEYVLIPAVDMLEIAQDNISKRKCLSEVIDILNLYSPNE